jgi:deoxycytidylate deaminase
VLTDGFGRICGTGFNGTPAKIDHLCDKGCVREGCAPGERLNECLAIHAEANALMHCSDIKKIDCCYIWGATPCWECAKLLCNSSVRIIFANKTYSAEIDRRVLDLLTRKNISVEIISFSKEVEDRTNEEPLIQRFTALESFLANAPK